MVDQTTDSSGRRTDVATDVADAGSRLKEEGRALSGTMTEVRDAVAAQARDLKDQAAGRLETEAESMQHEAAAGLGAFSDALKAASGELSGKKLGFAGDMVQQAADGLEGFARAIEGRSPGEMLEGIRSFGRQNPVGFIAGSVLAGFALGRLAAVLPAGAGSAGSSMKGELGAGSSMKGELGAGSSMTRRSGAGSSATGASTSGTSESAISGASGPGASVPRPSGASPTITGSAEGDAVPPRGGGYATGSTPRGAGQ